VIVRYRVDGMCQEKLRLPVKVGPALVARLKIMCNLEFSERRLPRTGASSQAVHEEEPRPRLARLDGPLNHGEGVVMRILDKQKTTLPLTSLGFSEENLGRYASASASPTG